MAHIQISAASISEHLAARRASRVGDCCAVLLGAADVSPTSGNSAHWGTLLISVSPTQDIPHIQGILQRQHHMGARTSFNILRIVVWRASTSTLTLVRSRRRRSRRREIVAGTRRGRQNKMCSYCATLTKSGMRGHDASGRGLRRPMTGLD